MKDEFPEFVEPEILQGAAGIIEVMKRIHEQPDSREHEWRAECARLKDVSAEAFGNRIQMHLNEGFSLRPMLADIQRGYVFWAGARLRKPEGE